MKNNENFTKYFYIGLTIFLVLLASIITYFLIKNLSFFGSIFKNIVHALIAIIIGTILTYIFSPMYNKIRDTIYLFLKKNNFGLNFSRNTSKIIATIICLATLFIIIFGLIMLFIPEFINSINELLKTLQKSTYNLDSFIAKFKLDKYSTQIHNYYDFAIKYITNSIFNFSTNYTSSFIANIFTGVFSIFKNILNSIIGIIVMCYLLNMKESILQQFRKFLIAILPIESSKIFFKECKFINTVFINFICGKLLDSFIIGILCYIGVRILGTPYPLVISTIIGVTNIIPFFGPFIGAIPCIILIALIEPIQSIYFAIFILVLQQFDGNILGPMILGGKTGVSSFYILLSILLFGSLWGFFGMIIAVPLWAVLQHFISMLCNKLLAKKNLSTNTNDYSNEFIDKFIDE